MKKILLFAAIAFSLSATAQEATEEKPGTDFYMATGLSVGNSGGSTFGATSYPSVEVGLMRGDWALGLVAGRSHNDYSVADVTENYWMEVKTAAYFPIGDNLDGYGLLGIGNYMSTETVFIEYGAGFSYSFGKLGTFVQASNWDGFWYVTPGLCYSF